MSPAVSIIVPVYNVSKYLDRCVCSLCNQTLKDIEIILVDDKSPDDSPKKCDEYSKKDSRIKVIHKKVNEGLGFARNTGMQIAKGKYIGFVDSDDYVDKTMYEKMYNLAESANADMVMSRYYNVTDDEKVSIVGEDYGQSSFIGDDVKKIILKMLGSLKRTASDTEIGVSVWKGLYSRKLLVSKGIKFRSERELISEDIVFNIDFLAEAKRVYILDDPLYYYCFNGQSLSKRYNPQRFEKEKELFLYENDRVKNIISKQDMQRLYKSFIGRVKHCIKEEATNNPNKKQARRNIKDMCTDSVVKEVFDAYDKSSEQVMRKKIFNYLIKHEQVLILEALSKH